MYLGMSESRNCLQKPKHKKSMLMDCREKSVSIHLYVCVSISNELQPGISHSLVYILLHICTFHIFRCVKTNKA